MTKTGKIKIGKFLALIVFCLFVVSNVSITQAQQQPSDMPGLAHDFPDSLGKLMDLDKRFSALSVEMGAVYAFKQYLANGAISPSDGGEFLHGLPAIIQNMEAGGAYSLSWTPLGGYLPSGSSMGYTYGRYVYEATDYEGNIITSHGKYVSIWHKQNDGKWKVIFDMGNTNPLPY